MVLSEFQVLLRQNCDKNCNACGCVLCVCAHVFVCVMAYVCVCVSDEVMLNVLRCQLTYQGQAETNAEVWFNNSLLPRKPEGALGRTAQDGHLDSHTAPELCVCECVCVCVFVRNYIVSGWVWNV